MALVLRWDGQEQRLAFRSAWLAWRTADRFTETGEPSGVLRAGAAGPAVRAVHGSRRSARTPAGAGERTGRHRARRRGVGELPTALAPDHEDRVQLARARLMAEERASELFGCGIVAMPEPAAPDPWHEGRRSRHRGPHHRARDPDGVRARPGRGPPAWTRSSSWRRDDSGGTRSWTRRSSTVSGGRSRSRARRPSSRRARCAGVGGRAATGWTRTVRVPVRVGGGGGGAAVPPRRRGVGVAEGPGAPRPALQMLRFGASTQGEVRLAVVDDVDGPAVPEEAVVARAAVRPVAGAVAVGDEVVGTVGAVELVPTGTAGDRVAVGLTVQLVVAATAVDLVAPAAAAQLVGSARPGEVVVAAAAGDVLDVGLDAGRAASSSATSPSFAPAPTVTTTGEVREL